MGYPQNNQQRNIAIAVVVALALILGGWYLMSHKDTGGGGGGGSTSKLNANSQPFMDYLFSGNTGAAYALLGPELKAGWSQQEFASDVKSVGISSGCNVNWSKHEVGKTTDGLPIDQDSGKLNCGGHSANLILQWVKYSNGFMLEGFSVKN